MNVPQDSQSARELIRSIARKHGHLAPEKLERISDPELRREVQEALMSKDQLIGSSVITLAKNLYSSNARFVFELLQNADDNQYEQARALKAEPFISFKVHPDRIVVECNEDGFTPENLGAVCAVGKSSKTGAQGYIGEKGIGFKSVFMVAWKVQIESGSLCFSFTHRPGDSGMGMISPAWEDDNRELVRPLTRMTLFLRDEAMEDGILRDSIHRQLSDIQETFLLFMRSLKQVSVAFFDKSGQETSRTSYQCQHQFGLASRRARLTRMTVVSGKTTETSKLFHLYTHKAINLAKNSNRTYSEEELALRTWSTSEIVLAFPVAKNELPIVEPQDLFVFMPVRSVGMNFIIQADFVTEANRQDVVVDSQRNLDLISAVAEAFVQTVLRFCDHPILKYQWMRYLPKLGQKGRGRLWDYLVNQIADRLARSKVVFSHKSNTRCLMSQLVYLAPAFVDAADQPLFDDLFPETILSRQYTSADAQVLRTYGVSDATWADFMLWLRHDLKQGTSSRIKSPLSSDNWHERVALWLNQFFKTHNLSITARDLRGMAMLPLSDGSWGWASPNSPIYFQMIDDLEIPAGTSLRIVDRRITNPSRLALFKHLGVQSATVDLVRRHIIRSYPDTTKDVNITLELSKQHVHFLIETEDSADEEAPGFGDLILYTVKGLQVRPLQQYLYLKTDDPFGPWELLRKTEAGSNIGDGAPGLDRDFLNPIYLQDVANDPQRRIKWTQWLHDWLNVERALWFAATEDSLDEVAEYVQEHRPEKFLGALQVWFEDNNQSIGPRLVETLQSTKVLTRQKHMVPLKDTYFPTKRLEEKVQRYVEPNVDFPWLWLGSDTSTSETIPQKWKALMNVLKINHQLSDLDFALDMLRWSLEDLHDQSEWLSESTEKVGRLLGLYQHVSSTFQDHTDRVTGEEAIRILFHDDQRRAIYVPAMSADDTCTWASARECVWDAPRLMVSKTVISRMWGRFLPRGLAFQNLEYFFTTVVRVAEYSYSTCVEELRALKDEDSPDIDAIRVWYEELNRLRRGSASPLRKPFEDEPLIYAPSAQGPSWHKVSQCVWSTASRLRGKPSLNDEYEHLQEFFVDFLGVRPVDLQMAVNELKEMADQGSSVDVIRESIWTVNSLLKVTAEWPKSTQVTKSRMFPVRLPCGEVSCLSGGDEFFVIDREAYRAAFEHHVKLLEFSLAEVAELDPFLRWTGLGGRYLSSCVKEVTSFRGGDAEVVRDSPRQIYNRAHALLRIAKQYGSPRVSSRQARETFYELLRNAQILGTDGVSSDIQLQQDGRTYTESGKTNAVYIHEHGAQLKVYIPRRKKDQVQAFKFRLPRKFIEWMLADPETQIQEPISAQSVAATEHAFNALGSMLEEMLEEDGIAAIDVENIDESSDDEDDDSIAEAMGDLAVVDRADSDPGSNGQGLTAQHRPPTGFADDEEEEDDPALGVATGFADDDEDSDLGVTAVHTPSTVSASSNWRAASVSRNAVAIAIQTQPLIPSNTPVSEQEIPPRVPSGDDQYASLLDYVVRAGRAADFPRWGEPGRVGLALAGNDRPVYLNESSRLERNRKVGAAGELFVFELLSNLERQHTSLPGFTRDNWQSLVRRYAMVHHEYANLEPWRGTETSDIVYSDDEGVLTRLLREKGYFEDLYLPSMQKPKYFIEVKATTSGRGEPFFMSGSQYARMQHSGLDPWNGTDLYIIFRIYNLGQASMGLQIYLDPERQRQQGNLVFTTDRWSVAPGSA